MLEVETISLFSCRRLMHQSKLAGNYQFEYYQDLFFHKQDQSILACQISSADGLEVNDDVSNLQVSLFLQVGQDSSPEEDLTLTNPEEVPIQLKSLNLQKQKRPRDYCDKIRIFCSLGAAILLSGCYLNRLNLNWSLPFSRRPACHPWNPWEWR